MCMTLKPNIYSSINIEMIIWWYCSGHSGHCEGWNALQDIQWDDGSPQEVRIIHEPHGKFGIILYYTNTLKGPLLKLWLRLYIIIPVSWCSNNLFALHQGVEYVYTCTCVLCNFTIYHCMKPDLCNSVLASQSPCMCGNSNTSVLHLLL